MKQTSFLLLGFFFAASCFRLSAQTIEPTDSRVRIEALTDSVAQDTVVKRKKFFTKVIDYFRDADKPDPNKNFDFGFIPCPHYSSTTGFGLGMVATGTYTMDKKDPLLPRSNVSIFGDITTEAFLLIGVKGINIFPKEKYRLDYRVYVYTFPTLFWGTGYENGKNDANETSYRRIRFDAMSKFLFRIAPNTYLGPMANFQFVQTRNIEAQGEHLFNGSDHNLRALSAGLSFTYDSRDFMLNAKKGWFMQLDQTFTPKCFGNDYHFITTDFTVSTYRKIWKGGVLAGEFHTKLNYGGTPAWCMMSDVGSGNRMRGYYEGRYRDKNILEAQVELRQKIKGRHGFVVWVGAAEVYPEWDELRFDKILPNAGLGYRWEFKKGINVRLDYGFTRDGGGFLFNINEAF